MTRRAGSSSPRPWHGHGARWPTANGWPAHDLVGPRPAGHRTGHGPPALHPSIAPLGPDGWPNSPPSLLEARCRRRRRHQPGHSFRRRAILMRNQIELISGTVLSRPAVVRPGRTREATPHNFKWAAPERLRRRPKVEPLGLRSFRTPGASRHRRATCPTGWHGRPTSFLQRFPQQGGLRRRSRRGLRNHALSLTFRRGVAPLLQPAHSDGSRL